MRFRVDLSPPVVVYQNYLIFLELDEGLHDGDDLDEIGPDLLQKLGVLPQKVTDGHLTFELLLAVYQIPNGFSFLQLHPIVQDGPPGELPTLGNAEIQASKFPKKSKDDCLGAMEMKLKEILP